MENDVTEVEIQAGTCYEQVHVSLNWWFGAYSFGVEDNCYAPLVYVKWDGGRKRQGFPEQERVIIISTCMQNVTKLCRPPTKKLETWAETDGRWQTVHVTRLLQCVPRFNNNTWILHVHATSALLSILGEWEWSHWWVACYTLSLEHSGSIRWLCTHIMDVVWPVDVHGERFWQVLTTLKEKDIGEVISLMAERIDDLWTCPLHAHAHWKRVMEK